MKHISYFVYKAAKEYKDFAESNNFHSDKIDDYENAIVEAVMINIYGQEFYDKINKRMEEE